MCDVICRVHINECTLCVPLYVHTEVSEEHWHIPLLLSSLLSWDRKLLNLISIPPCWGYRHIQPCPDFHLCPGDKNSDSSLCRESSLTHCAISLTPRPILLYSLLYCFAYDFVRSIWYITLLKFIHCCCMTLLSYECQIQKICSNILHMSWSYSFLWGSYLH